MILSDSTIKLSMQKGLIEIDNFQEKHLNSNSYDVTLNKEGWGLPEATGTVKEFHGQDLVDVIDPLNKSSYTTTGFMASRYTLYPQCFVIASVNERTWVSNGMVMQLGGKSSLARLGLAVHVTAGFGDAGWGGFYVLELVNLGPKPIRLTAGMPIAQIVFERSDLSELPYNERNKSKYQDQKPGQGSKYYLNKELLDESK